MTRLYLVRHGETDWNARQLIQGSTDIPLNDAGRRQALSAAGILGRRTWDAIATSPLSRAMETANIIARELKLLAPIQLADIVERNYGEAEGLNWREIEAKFPDDTPVPGRETRDEVTARVIPALLALAAEHPDDSLIVVTHGGVIRSVLGRIDATASHGPIRNGSIHSFLVANDSLELIAFDDPIEDEVVEPVTGRIEAQNALEARDASAL